MRGESDSEGGKNGQDELETLQLSLCEGPSEVSTASGQLLGVAPDVVQLEVVGATHCCDLLRPPENCLSVAAASLRIRDLL